MTQGYRDPQGRPINQFGTPVGAPMGPPPDLAPPPPPYGTVAPYGTVPPPYVGYAPAPPGMSTGAKVALALGGAVAAIVVLGILAAIAIPVFLNQRARAEAQGISVTLPDQVAGYARMSGPADDSVQNIVSEVQGAGLNAHGAAFGDQDKVTVVVIVGQHLMLTKDRSSFLAGVARTEANAGVVQTPAEAGPLGGQMRCGEAADGSRTDCAFADAGAYGVIDVAVTGASALTLVHQIRAEVETHR